MVWVTEADWLAPVSLALTPKAVTCLVIAAARSNKWRLLVNLWGTVINLAFLLLLR